MNRVQISFIKQALEYENMLSEWENRFINDLADKPETYQLTDKQNQILNRIQRKVNE